MKLPKPIRQYLTNLLKKDEQRQAKSNLDKALVTLANEFNRNNAFYKNNIIINLDIIIEKTAQTLHQMIPRFMDYGENCPKSHYLSALDRNLKTRMDYIKANYNHEELYSFLYRQISQVEKSWSERRQRDVASDLEMKTQNVAI
jgi:hypothetical protein